MNLFYEDYPESITVGEQEIRIRTDFREYIRMIDLLKSDELRDSEKWQYILQYFYDQPDNMASALDGLVDFVNLEQLREKISESDEDNQEDGGNRYNINILIKFFCLFTIKFIKYSICFIPTLGS